MCTVSFIPLQNGCVLTSNRDEKIYRPTIEPLIYEDEKVKLLYPKDEKAGGTWIVAKQNGVCLVLLNGAFVNHQKKDNYRKSRGVILMEIAKAVNELYYFTQMDLSNIEPFTIILFANNELFDLKWDGNQKYILPKSIKQNHIWSSATLYNRKQKNYRKKWFEEFCRYETPLNEDKVFDFHNTVKKDNLEYGLVIERADKTNTVSITQIRIKGNQIKMNYTDKITNVATEKYIF